jgi:hypothetical protein
MKLLEISEFITTSLVVEVVEVAEVAEDEGLLEISQFITTSEVRDWLLKDESLRKSFGLN